MTKKEALDMVYETHPDHTCEAGRCSRCTMEGLVYELFDQKDTPQKEGQDQFMVMLESCETGTPNIYLVDKINDKVINSWHPTSLTYSRASDDAHKKCRRHNKEAKEKE